MKTVDLSDKVKYPRSYHLPFSPGATSDDKKWTNEQAIVYTTGKDLVVTEKMDGTCFPAIAPILMSDGSIKPIQDIKIGDVVLGVDKNRNIVNSTVIRTFKNGKTDKWLKIYFKSPFNSKKKYLICTENHELFVNGKYTEAKYVSRYDTFSHVLKYTEPSQIQKEILIGTLLGDASFNSNRRHVTYCHKIEHKEYSKFLDESLTDLYSSSYINKNANSFSGKPKYVSTTKSITWLKDLSEEMIVNNVKTIPKTLIPQITPLSLAVLYMDDGHLTESTKQRPRMHFSVCNFDTQSCLNLQEAFKNFGIKTTITNSDGYNYLNVSAYSVDDFCNLIKNYIPEIMQYKLPIKYRGLQVKSITNHKSSTYIKLANSEVVDIKTLSDFKYTQRYDLETSTNNYMVNGVLVHNCCTLYSDYYHNRSINTSYHPAFDWIKRYHAELSVNIPNGIRICGEYLYNTHSISYDNLESYFYGFSVWDGDKCLSWEDTLEWFKLLDITPVPTIAENIGYHEKLLTMIGEDIVNQGKEGIVVRNRDSFLIDKFSQNLAKYVRANHVTTSEHWLHSKLSQNKLRVK